MRFFAALLVNGLLAGAIYALLALAFVVVYKASGAINFALGELTVLGSRLVKAGSRAVALSLERIDLALRQREICFRALDSGLLLVQLRIELLGILDCARPLA